MHHNLCLTYLLTTDRCIWPSLYCWLFPLIIQVDCELGPMCVSSMWCSLYWIFRADSHYVTFLFCHGTSPFSKIFSHVNRVVHTDRNVSITSQFCSIAVAEWEYLTWWNGSKLVCTCLFLIMWTVLHLFYHTSSVCVQQVLPVCLQKWMKHNRIGV